MSNRSKPTLTFKQESFCQKTIELGSAYEAYKLCYDVSPTTKKRTVQEMSCRLAAEPKIAARIKELKAMQLERHFVTVESITQELEEARSLALKIEAPSAAVSASLGKAKLNGLLEEKPAAQVNVQINNLSAIDFARRAAFLFAKAQEEMENDDGNISSDGDL